MIEELAKITPQRPLIEVAGECEMVFSDRSIEIDSLVVADPFRSALDFTIHKKKVCLAVFGGYFTVVFPDARWMQSLRLYQSIE